MRLQSPTIPTFRGVRFGNTGNPADDPESQQNAVPAGSATYGDGKTEYFLAVNKTTNTATVYVKTNRPDPDVVLREAPDKFSLVNSPIKLTFKPYRETP